MMGCDAGTETGEKGQGERFFKLERREKKPNRRTEARIINPSEF